MTQLFVQLAQSVTGNVITIVALNIVAAAIGYLIAWLYAKSVYTPVIKGLEADKVTLNKEVASLNVKISDLNVEVSKLKDEINNLNETIRKSNEKIVKLEGEIAEKDKEIKANKEKEVKNLST
jgi:peptidoglycan hydrolase CwlO-like protein